MQDKRPTQFSRRNFLRALGGASATTVAAVTVAPDEALAYDPGGEETRARYRETDHIKAFYRVNGYPKKE